MDFCNIIDQLWTYIQQSMSQVENYTFILLADAGDTENGKHELNSQSRDTISSRPPSEEAFCRKADGTQQVGGTFGTAVVIIVRLSVPKHVS